MNREIARQRAVTAKRYARPARHAIQVDFLTYQREIRKERRAGARRSAAPDGSINQVLRDVR
jgi:dimethylaniline monooxygenase (N-oxide forming)